MHTLSAPHQTAPLCDPATDGPPSPTTTHTVARAQSTRFINPYSRRRPVEFCPDLVMGTKGRATPRVVCCAIPIARAAAKILLITSRKRPDNWVCECAAVAALAPRLTFVCATVPKGGWEAFDVRLENAATREALEEAGARGTITRFVTTQQSPSTIYHFYELDVVELDKDWLEDAERRREWVDYAEAVRRLEWKAELANGIRMCSLAPPR